MPTWPSHHLPNSRPSAHYHRTGISTVGSLPNRRAHGLVSSHRLHRTGISTDGFPAIRRAHGLVALHRHRRTGISTDSFAAIRRAHGLASFPGCRLASYDLTIELPEATPCHSLRLPSRFSRLPLFPKQQPPLYNWRVARFSRLLPSSVQQSPLYNWKAPAARQLPAWLIQSPQPDVVPYQGTHCCPRRLPPLL